MNHDINNELLPNRLNGEPAIFRGCTLSDLMGLTVIGTLIWVPFWIVVCAVLGAVMMGVGIGLLNVIGWVVLGGTVLQHMKRGRPLGYHALKIHLMLADWGLRNTPYIRDSRVWGVGRRR